MNLAEIIARHARSSPGAVAIDEGGRALSYAQLESAIRRAAAALSDAGIRRGETVGLTMRSSALHLVAAYALAYLGAVQVALPRRDPSGVRRALALRFGIERVLGDGDDAGLDGLPLVLADPAWFDDSAQVPQLAAAPGGDSPWRLVLSSGTTAEPKAVLQTHAMHVAWREIYSRAMPVAAADRYFSAIGLDFYAGIRQCMEMHWVGACVVLDDPEGSAEEFYVKVRRARANSMLLLPSHLHGLLPRIPDDRLRLPGVRVLRVGAMVVSPGMRERVRRCLTPNLVVTYGTNDLGSVLTRADPDTEARHPGSVGYPSPGVQLQIVDDADRPLPPGEVGHIRARAPGMPSAFHGNPAASARSFRLGWYYPGDMGSLTEDGALYFKGRADDLMNFNGMKIYPSDIEQALLAHPAVREVAALPVRSTQHQDIPVAVVVLGGPASEEELYRWCRDRLGSRSPRLIAAMKALPRNATGKVLKRELSRMLAERVAAIRSP